MENELIIIFAIIFALIAGMVIFIIIKTGKKKNTGDMNLSIASDAGICRVIGTKNEFEMYFEKESVGFYVKDGVITKYKTKNHSGYKNYIEGV